MINWIPAADGLGHAVPETVLANVIRAGGREYQALCGDTVRPDWTAQAAWCLCNRCASRLPPGAQSRRTAERIWRIERDHTPHLARASR